MVKPASGSAFGKLFSDLHVERCRDAFLALPKNAPAPFSECDGDVRAQNGKRRGRDSGNPHRLTQRFRANLAQALDHFGRQTRHRGIEEFLRDPAVLVTAAACDLQLLAFQIALILQRRLDAGNVEPADRLLQLKPIADKIRQPGLRLPKPAARHEGLVERSRERLVSNLACRARKESQRAPSIRPIALSLRSQPEIRIIDSEQQPILRSRRKHPIGL